MTKTAFILLFVISIFGTIGCKEKKAYSLIHETIGQKIETDIQKNDSSRFTILRYIENPACTSCQLKLGEWKIYGKRLKKKFGNKVNLQFLCNTKNAEEAKFLFEIYGFSDVAKVDSLMNFYEKHHLNPMLGKDVVFLLDSTNTVLSIGNPNENLKIDSLFNSIILGHFSIKTMQ